MKFNIETRSDNGRKITKPDLKVIIMELQETAPGIGIRMIEGQLRSKGLRSSRDEIAEVLRILDPIGTIIRWNEQIPRVTYSVPGKKSSVFFSEVRMMFWVALSQCYVTYLPFHEESSCPKI